LEVTLQITSATMITFMVRIAMTGERVRSFTSASFFGMSRSNDQANRDRIGMNVLAIMDGNDQNRKQPKMITVKNGMLTDAACEVRSAPAVVS
jgi:hypothetical protein